MKKCYLFLLVILLLSSCGKKKEEIPSWDGKTDLGGPHHGEPVCILWMEPVSGMSDFWYPLKGFSDVKQMQEIIHRLNLPDNPGQYGFYTPRYLLICFARRDLKAVKAIRVPFLIDNNEFVCPMGKDKNLYSLLTSAPTRENYYGNPKELRQIVNSKEYREFWKAQLSREPNLPPESNK